MRRSLVVVILLAGSGGRICFGRDRIELQAKFREEGSVAVKVSARSLIEILQQIQTLYKVNFLYDANLDGLRTSYRVDPKKNIETVLKELLAPLSLRCVRLDEKNYVIKRIAEAEVLKRVEKAGTEAERSGRINEVRGRVVDEGGNPLAGATIVIKGTQNGVRSDSAGGFVIAVPDSHDPVLDVSFIGMKGQEVEIQKQRTVRVVLARADRQADDVVVVGYGKQLRRDVVTAVSTTKAEEIEEANTVNLGNALQGKVNGAIIVSRSGTPGRDRPLIMIRGNNPNQPPLIVIDGVPRYQDLGAYNPGGLALNGVTLDDINPEEVESISILKDNAATAVYGTRGAFGVVLVTTKRGKAGKPKIDFSTRYGVDGPTRFPKLVDGYHYALAQNEYNANSGQAPAYTESTLEIIRNHWERAVYANTSLNDLMQQRSASQQANTLSISGGTDQVRYFINGSVTSQKSSLKAFDYSRYTVQSNLDIKVSRELKLGLNMGFRNTTTDAAAILTGDGVFGGFLFNNPLIPIHNLNGTLYATDEYGNKWANTIPELSGYQNYGNMNLDLQSNLEYAPSSIPGLVFRLNNSLNYNGAFNKAFQDFYAGFVPDGTSPTGYRQTAGFTPNNLRENLGTAMFYNTDLGFDYTRNLRSHRISLTALGTKYYSHVLATQVYRDGVVAGAESINSGRTLNQTTNGYETEAGRLGGVIRLNYDYKSKYSFEYSMRADASDNFPAAHRWGYFPGGALAWRMSKERFIYENWRFIEDLKLRASMGFTGIDNLSPFNYYYTYNIANSGMNGGGGYAFGGVYQPSLVQSTSNIPNPDVTWGRSMMRNIGMDFSLWKGLLSGSFDVYDKHLSQLPHTKALSLPQTFGIGAPMFNFAREYYSGFEAFLSNHLRLGKDLGLETSVNFTYNYSRVVDYGEPANTAPYLRKQGYSITSNHYYQAAGIFQTQDEIAKYPVDLDGQGNATIKPGDIKYADLDRDGKLTVADQVVKNNVNLPPYFFGLNLDFHYKEFSVNVFFQGAGGNEVEFVPAMNTQYGYDHSWRLDNPGAIYPRLSSSANNLAYVKPSTLFLRSGNYLRFKNLKFAYKVPKRYLQKVGLTDATITASALNLGVLSRIRDIDPEAQMTNINNGGYYPIQRNYGIGLHIGL
jgi:TonB-linked SusC/RagA family outer membrane protein